MVRDRAALARITGHRPVHGGRSEAGSWSPSSRRRPSPAACRSIESVDAAPENVRVLGREAYLDLPNGVGRSVLAPVLERRLGVAATARNLDHRPGRSSRCSTTIDGAEPAGATDRGPARRLELRHTTSRPAARDPPAPSPGRRSQEIPRCPPAASSHPHPWRRRRTGGRPLGRPDHRRRGRAIDWEEAEAGAEVFKLGDTSGVPAATRDSIERTQVVLKGPLETPVGFGEKSANVTLRKLFETYANVRPARELPGVPTRYAGEGIDLVIVRENIEDLYAGIEHMQTPDVGQCLKVISRKGSEKVIRYAFELARREGRAKVTCATKANIMKLTEGLFKAVFEELAPEYPEIATEHLIIDNVAHQLAKDAGPVRRRGHHEPQRRHHQRPRQRAGRRARASPSSGNYGDCGRDLRGGPRLGPEVRRQGRDQPDRADPQLGDDAPPPRRGGRRATDRGCRAGDARGAARR